MKISCILATLCAVSSTHAQDEKAYTIKTQRPSRAGDRIHEVIKAEISESFLLKVGEKKLKEDNLELHFEMSGVRQVIAVNANGRATKLTFTVETSSLREGDKKPSQPFKQGDVISSSLDEKGRKQFEVAGSPVKGAPAKAIGEILGAAAEDAKVVDGDKLLGTDEPRSIGSEWQPNAVALLRSLPGGEARFLPDGLRTTMHFEKVEAVSGAQCCKLVTKTTAKAAPGMGGPGIKEEKNTLTITDEEWYPVDAALPVLKASSDWQMDHSGIVSRPEGEASFKGLRRLLKQTIRNPAQ